MVDYVLITPVKNEEEYLPILADSIINQTTIPKIWVIVDGNSIDNTPNIIKELCQRFDWIYFHKQKQITKQKNHLNFAYGVQEGYECCQHIAQEKNITYDYVGKLDADVILPKEFFEKLIYKFERNPLLGVVSGVSHNLKSKPCLQKYTNIKEKDYITNNYLPDELPDKRLYRKKYLDEVGQFPLSKYSPDTVLLAKFRIKGWDIKTFDDIHFFNLRDDTGTERNLWKSAKSYGENRFYLNYNPFLVLINTLMLMLKKPHYTALAYVYGYTSSLIFKKEKIHDKEIQYYFMSVRPREILKMVQNKQYTIFCLRR